MDSLILNSITQLGAVGILVGFLIWLVVRYEKRMKEIHLNHSVERREWQKQAATQHEDVIKIAKESNIVLTEIRTLIKSMRVE